MENRRLFPQGAGADAMQQVGGELEIHGFIVGHTPVASLSAAPGLVKRSRAGGPGVILSLMIGCVDGLQPSVAYHRAEHGGGRGRQLWVKASGTPQASWAAT